MHRRLGVDRNAETGLSAKDVAITSPAICIHCTRRGYALLHPCSIHFDDSVARQFRAGEIGEQDLLTISKNKQTNDAMSTTTIKKTDNKTKSAPKLKPGCHIVMIAQNKGGEAKSSSALEVHLAALASGIPSILATLDQSNKTLAVALGGDDKVMALDMGSANDLQRALADAMDAAEEAGAILVIDTPPTYVDTNHPLIPAITRSRAFEGENSIAAMIPLRAAGDSVIGAVDALRVMPVDFTRGLIRAWRHDPAAPQWEYLPGYEILKAKYPVWEVGTWLQTTEDIFHKQGDFSSFPNLDELEDYANSEGMTHSRFKRSAMRVTLCHMEDARRAIYHHLLKPIMVS